MSKYRQRQKPERSADNPVRDGDWRKGIIKWLNGQGGNTQSGSDSRLRSLLYLRLLCDGRATKRDSTSERNTDIM